MANDRLEVGVLGAGSWGTALAKLLADNGHAVTLWGRSPEAMRQMEEARENSSYLKGVRFPGNLRATGEVAAAVRGKAMVVSVVPSQVTRATLVGCARDIAPGTLLVGASKGIENETLATMDEVFAEVVPHARSVFLSGPSFAREVGRGVPTAVVVASRDADAALAAQRAFSSERFRAYTSDDVVGVEIGGALKNVMAIASGIADGLEFGYNTRAAIITRGLAEMARLAVKRGGNPLTLAGLAGMGDLVLTCTGDLSRNRHVGVELGRGRPLEQILGGMKEVAEGVRTTRSAFDLSRRVGVDMPITAAVHAVLYGGKPPRDLVIDLMTRSLKEERG